MSERIDRLDRMVDRPPVIVLSGGEHGPAVEYAVLVGWCAFKDPVISSGHQLETLRVYGLHLDLAGYDVEDERWERVLSSEEIADILVDAGDDLPFVFELGLSMGGLTWIERSRQEKAGKQPQVLPLRAYVTPAPAEVLDLLEPRPSSIEGPT
jgi:hypothetical protein